MSQNNGSQKHATSSYPLKGAIVFGVIVGVKKLLESFFLKHTHTYNVYDHIICIYIHIYISPKWFSQRLWKILPSFDQKPATP